MRRKVRESLVKGQAVYDGILTRTERFRLLSFISSLISFIFILRLNISGTRRTGYFTIKLCGSLNHLNAVLAVSYLENIFYFVSHQSSYNFYVESK